MKVILFIIMMLLSVTCFCEDDGFQEEFIDFEPKEFQTERIKEDEELAEDEQSLEKENELKAIEEQNKKDIRNLQRIFDSEEDGIKRI